MVALGSWATARGQVPAEPVLEGLVRVGEVPLPDATVVLHHLTEDSQGEIDSTAVGPDGSFSFRLPHVPDPERTDVYFASVRHQGVLYFGPALTLPIQLDSVYAIQVYDTAMVAPPGAAPLRVEARNLFFEQEAGRWRVTDLFQVVNEGSRTLVAPEGEAVWAYPIPPTSEARTVGSGDLAGDGAGFEGDRFVVRSPIPPGERLWVVRYVVPDLFGEIPTKGRTGVLEVLVREPAPALDVPGLTPVRSVELESGSSYRRFVGEDHAAGVVRLVEGRVVRPPPVEWLGVLTLLLLGVAAAVTFRRTPAAPRSGTLPSREEVLLDIARLDERFEAEEDPDARRVEEYRRRRAALLDRLRGGP